MFRNLMLRMHWAGVWELSFSCLLGRIRWPREPGGCLAQSRGPGKAGEAMGSRCKGPKARTAAGGRDGLGCRENTEA